MKRIRQVHKVVRNRAHAHFDDEKTYLSQTDLAHTPFGYKIHQMFYLCFIEFYYETKRPH